VVVHEAASCGLPLLVSTAAGACHVLVEDGVSGFRFDPTDATALARRMKEIIEDEALRKSLGAGARQTALHWSSLRSGERVAEWLMQFAPGYFPAPDHE
jgi:glycosyltransferase involved in cell wall biosynthesis